ncbi:HNH endonuclease [Synechocystis salina]|uniref:HNH endonuclease n=1 Tax=Synechocystis salina TaxID=945780 RepID=UPI0030B87671
MFRAQTANRRKRDRHGSMLALCKSVAEVKLFGYLDFTSWQVNKDGYFFLIRENKSEFFELLEKTGFFEFHETNTSKNSVYQHQVSKFLASGYKIYGRGYYARKGEVEIHHLDSNQQNNDPRNLRYVSPGLNYFIARSLRFPYTGEISNCITETREEAKEMLLLSLKRTLNYRGRELTQEQLDFLLKLRLEQAQSILNEWYRADNKYNNIVNIKVEQFSLTTTRETLLAKTKTNESPIFL